MSTLIITGGRAEAGFFREYFKNRTFCHIIAVDGGLLFAEALGLVPDYIVGDFDTLPEGRLAAYEGREGVTIRHFCPEKDDTDTQIAVELALELEKEEVIMIGAAGTRLDHSIANLFLLEKFERAGISAYCLDGKNRVRVLQKGISLQKVVQYGDFVSFLALTDTVEGITLKGFKYPLLNRTLHQDDSLCVSNEIVEETAEISFQKGLLLMIEAKD